MASKNIKLQSISLMKDVQDVYTVNWAVVERYNEDMNNWNGIILLWIRRFNIFNIPTLSHKFNIIPIKIPSFLIMLNIFLYLLVTWVLLVKINQSVTYDLCTSLHAC